ncbi:hypothetical protein ABIB94_007433 [Bradyrhizobium sp. JR7.2]|uniref:Uncharacterized protein n=1 Tax=Bradyrhizobium barranii TaxID=2992140 RepID=A0ABY3R090_9BRAD|nr:MULTISPECIES: hypothetical protein [Bradyrhizobium]UFW91709.1 hypothetical protein BjapCC829_45455 [Bradyrhizobium japonicum]WFU00233.1 hypothetical protein QA633_46210 [Bradyrhizobium barranii]
MAKHPPITLAPFFQPGDEGAAEQRMYVAGFADEAGEAWGTLIPLDAEMVEHAVLGQQTFTVWCNSDGRIQSQPTSDSVFEDLLEKDQLKETPLDELVAEAIEQGKNEPNDDILDMFETLHERLVRAQGMVADEIARRRR